jgi:hypothetical protein
MNKKFLFVLFLFVLLFRRCFFVCVCTVCIVSEFPVGMLFNKEKWNEFDKVANSTPSSVYADSLYTCQLINRERMLCDVMYSFKKYHIDKIDTLLGKGVNHIPTNVVNSKYGFMNMDSINNLIRQNKIRAYSAGRNPSGDNFFSIHFDNNIVSNFSRWRAI